LNWWQRINRILDLEAETTAPLPAEVLQLAEERERARLAKDWRKSDELRDKLSALGWEVRDTKEGRKITKRAGA
jgi:cysteinyl-tRNA synthetase